MSFITAIAESVSTRGGTMIIKIKQDLRAAGKSVTGKLISGTHDETTISGSKVLYKGISDEGYWVIIDKGRRAGATPPPIKAIDNWIKKKGLELNAYAVAKSIGKKGIKPTNIYTDAVDGFIKGIDFSNVRSEIIKDIKTR